MKVWVTGASGMVGGNFVNVFKNNGFRVCGSHYSNPLENTVFFDTLDPSNPDNFDINEFFPDVVVHAGAMTHVDACEEDPEKSYHHTVSSAQNVASLAKKFNAALVYISSDYIFEGKEGPYSENITPAPVSVYGKHKLEAENIVRNTTEKHLILRITNVYGHEVQGKNFVVRLMKNVSKGESMDLKLPYDQYATPINARDVARAAEKLLSNGKTGVYHLGSTDYMNRVQLAQKVLSYMPGHKATIIPVSTEKLGQPAPRPLQGGLKPEKFLREFPDFAFSNVDDFIKELQSNTE